MILKYQTHFSNLSPEHVAHVTAAVSARHAWPEPPTLVSGIELWQFCQDAGLDQADVVVSMADDATPLGVVCIETLIGHPIVRGGVGGAKTPQQRTPPRTRQPRGAAVRRSDPRVIVEIAPNPKKPGSLSHARYALYVVGMSVDAALAAGVRQEDIRYDSSRGFIKFGD